ncbi:hypothetical protein QIA41_04755 (plasmid) [Borreliella sinica]|uniref:hypothetical protein n=1 Tax=Borreliella sinica TaxID=87162 RepID=UPI002A243876|nr:hypothetical protein [Borreliella sinica]WPM06406.1 hypothetical protein QIA41_04755 [Borreliella sinica]
MKQFKLILIFIFFIASTIYAGVARPFDFRKWNFKKDIDLAYVLMYDSDNGILTKSQDKAGRVKSQEIFAKLNKLNVYSDSLQKTIKNKLVRSRFRKEVELPLLKLYRKYKYLTRRYKNKSLIENPEYTKLIVERIIKKVTFLEDYFQSRLKSVKSIEKIKKKYTNRSGPKSFKGSKTNRFGGSKFSENPKTSKGPHTLKKCDKKQILDNHNLGFTNGKILKKPDSAADLNDLNIADPDDRDSTDDLDDLDDLDNPDNLDNPDSSDDLDDLDDPDSSAPDEFFDSAEDKFSQI